MAANVRENNENGNKNIYYDNVKEHVNKCSNCGKICTGKVTLIDHICYTHLVINLCSLCTETFSNTNSQNRLILEIHRQHDDSQDDQNMIKHCPEKKS